MALKKHLWGWLIEKFNQILLRKLWKNHIWNLKAPFFHCSEWKNKIFLWKAKTFWAFCKIDFLPKNFIDENSILANFHYKIWRMLLFLLLREIFHLSFYCFLKFQRELQRNEIFSINYSDFLHNLFGFHYIIVPGECFAFKRVKLIMTFEHDELISLKTFQAVWWKSLILN